MRLYRAISLRQAFEKLTVAAQGTRISDRYQRYPPPDEVKRPMCWLIA